jgi:hypothetical protein
MADELCPFCRGSLELREASPCHECGGDPESLARFRRGETSHYSVKMFGGLELVLCEICMVNFGSHDPKFFGQRHAYGVGFEHMEILKQIQNPSSRNDLFCPSCGYRRTFLRFVKEARAKASS